MQRDELIPKTYRNLEELLDFMTRKLAAFHEEDPDGFVQLMYRLDIDERFFLQAPFSFMDLAIEVLRREAQKIKSRNAQYPPTLTDPDLSW